MIAKLISQWIDTLLFSEYCENCNNLFSPYLDQNYYCQDCIKALKNKLINKQLVYCKHCGKKGVDICEDCLKSPLFDEIRIGYTYSGLIRDILLKIKFENIESLCKVLAFLIKDDFLQFIEKNQIDYILYIPSSKEVEKKRGFNHLKSILKHLSIDDKLKDNLVKLKDTDLQVGKSKEDRKFNLKDAFYLKNPWVFENKKLLVFDDILTTGETLKEIKNIIIKANPVKIYSYVISF